MSPEARTYHELPSHFLRSTAPREFIFNVDVEVFALVNLKRTPPVYEV
jgi:hypothetical protein